MGTAQYLIDSNAVTDYLANLLPTADMAFMHPIIDALPNLSVITRIEIVGFNSPDADLIGELVASSVVYDLTETIIVQTIALRKSRRIKLPDAIIAATALAHSFKLLTENESDFAGIRGLSIRIAYEGYQLIIRIRTLLSVSGAPSTPSSARPTILYWSGRIS